MIATDFKLERNAEWGTPRHKKLVFGMLKNAAVFFVKGTKVKLSRWMTIWDSWFEFRAFKTVYLLILTYLLLKHKIIKTRSDVFAICCAARTELVRAVVPGVEEVVQQAGASQPESAPTKQEVRLPDKDIDAKRAKANNTLHLAFIILCDPAKTKIMDGLALAMKDLRIRFGQSIVAFNNRSRSLEWAVENAAGRCTQKVILNIVCCMDQPSEQAQIGFLDSEAFGDDQHEPSVVADRLVARVLWDAARELINFNFMGFLLMSATLPFYFAMLASSKQEDVAQGLQTLSRWFSALDKLEHYARGQKICKDLLTEMHWARCPWVRMIFIGLKEARFLSVPRWVAKKIGDRLSCFLSSVGVEYLNRAIRSAEKNMNDNQDLSRTSRWYSAARSPVLGDIDRHPMRVTQTATRLAPNTAPPDDIYDPESYALSLANDPFAALLAGRFHWVAPQTSNQIPIAWLGWLHVGCDPKRYANLYFSLLAQKGSVLRHTTASEDLHLVLRSSKAGVVVYNLAFFALGQQCGFQMSRKPDAENCKVLHIEDPSHWQVLELSILSPGESHHLSSSIKSFKGMPGITAVSSARAVGFVKHAVRKALPGVHTTYLRKLYNFFQIDPDGGRPTSDRGFVRAIMKHHFPLISDEELAELLKQRFEPKPDAEVVASNLLSEEHLGMAAEVLEEVELEKLKEKTKKHCVSSSSGLCVGAGAGGVGTGEGGSSSSASGGIPPVPPAPDVMRIPRPLGVATWTREEIGALMPPVGGIRISNSSKWDSRWKVEYPSTPIQHTSATFGGVRDEEQAVLLLVRFAWACFNQNEPGGPTCPWDLSRLDE